MGFYSLSNMAIAPFYSNREARESIRITLSPVSAIFIIEGYITGTIELF